MPFDLSSLSSNPSYGGACYLAFMLIALVFSFRWWDKLSKVEPRLLIIFFAACAGAFLGSKVLYLLAEGWMSWEKNHQVLELLTGKTILGGLIGGYIAVELAKFKLGYRKSTGDFFALCVPLSIALGRIGCWLNGCCLGVQSEKHWYTIQDAQGVWRWPSAPLECLFNLVFLVFVFRLKQLKRCKGQLFHLYLMSYGIFRFLHEFMRNTPNIFIGVTLYQIAALGLTFWGLYSWRKRALNA